MTRQSASLAIFAFCGAAAFAWQPYPAAHQDTFRARTDLLMLDVSVLDKARQPVNGLAAEDFTVMVDGQARPVVAFKAVEMPPVVLPPSAEAAWVREVGPDVEINTHPPGRIVAIIIDDYGSLGARMGPDAISKGRQTALAVVDALRPGDRAAVVFTFNAHTAQTFTTDRQLLRAAILGAAIFPLGSPAAAPAVCDCGVCSIQALEIVARALRPLSGQRKVAFYISAGSVMPVPRPLYEKPTDKDQFCIQDRRMAMWDALRQLHLSNVAIQTFDPTGLSSPVSANAQNALAGRRGPFGALEDPATQRIESLRMIAESTGGRAVVNNNDPDLQVPSVLAESSSYYLLGVEPPTPSPDGQFHPVQVRVNRRDVDVRTRNGYYDPREKDRLATVAALEAGEYTPLITSPVAMAGIPLVIAVAPFATSEGHPTVAIALSVGRTPGDAPLPGPRTEIVDMIAGLFYPETAGTAGWQQQRLSLTWTHPDPRFDSYEMLSRVSVPPGRYELRVGVKTADGRTSSVYTTVDVPDFESPLSLSGLVVSATPSPAVAPPDALSDVLPIVPTPRRVFQKTDHAAAFLRVYQRARSFAPVTVATTITNTRGAVVASDHKQIHGAPAPPGSSADYRVELPLEDLAPGEYLLTVRVAVGNRNAQRHLRFRVEVGSAIVQVK